ncbi:hypothetical protein K438DRAFT_1939611 [Mycena galopus ATCC 62051]|nr:hypothetical protein K438DRAFT_1939611 [Mycena galopus ATCC 62051]
MGEASIANQIFPDDSRFRTESQADAYQVLDVFKQEKASSGGEKAIGWTGLAPPHHISSLGPACGSQRRHGNALGANESLLSREAHESTIRLGLDLGVNFPWNPPRWKGAERISSWNLSADCTAGSRRTKWSPACRAEDDLTTFAWLLGLIVRTSRRPDDGGREGHVRKVPRTLDPYPTDLVGPSVPTFCWRQAILFEDVQPREQVQTSGTNNLAPLLARRAIARRGITPGCTGVANGDFSSSLESGWSFAAGKPQAPTKANGRREGHRVTSRAQKTRSSKDAEYFEDLSSSWLDTEGRRVQSDSMPLDKPWFFVLFLGDNGWMKRTTAAAVYGASKIASRNIYLHRLQRTLLVPIHEAPEDTQRLRHPYVPRHVRQLPGPRDL